MDTLAAFALGTEPPLAAVVAGQPYENMRVMQPEIWRQIYGMSLWNVIVMMCVVFIVPLTVSGGASGGMSEYTMVNNAARAVGQD